MHLNRRAVVVVVVALAAVAIAGCIPTVPPGGTSSATFTPGCRSGATTSYGSGAFDWPAGVGRMGTYSLSSRVCWDQYGNIVSIAAKTQSCTPSTGFISKGTTARFQATGPSGALFTTCTFQAASNASQGGVLVMTHTWQSGAVLGLTLTSCASVANAHCQPATYNYDATPESPPTTTPTTKPTSTTLPKPTTTTTAEKTVTFQGYILPVSDAVPFTRKVSIQGIAAYADADGVYRQTMPYQDQYFVSVEVPPTALGVGYTLCINRTDCHWYKPKPGKYLFVNTKPGDVVDLWWHYDFPPVTVQGIQWGTNQATRDAMKLENLYVYIDDVQYTPTQGLYVIQNLTAGQHVVRVSVPIGWKIGYTLCYDRVDCHTAPPISDHKVTVDVRPGGFADLWWHYTM